MNVKIQPGEIVYANAGRDKGKYYIVLSLEDEFLYLCNGKSRKLENLKRKKAKHVCLTGVKACSVAERLASGQQITDKQIREAISEVKKKLESNS